MKARVKETGEIVDVEYIIHTLLDGRKVECYETENAIYVADALDFDIVEKSLPKDEPDYWEKLRRQYAGMALQGLLSNWNYVKHFIDNTLEGESLSDLISMCAYDYATALIERLKEEEK